MDTVETKILKEKEEYSAENKETVEGNTIETRNNERKIEQYKS